MNISDSDQQVDDLFDALRAGDRRALARGITLVESSSDRHRTQALRLLEKIMPYTGTSLRVGISGVPGVGKSSFIEAFGSYLVAQGRRVAVLTIDPSSPLTGGSILGDKTRMENLARNRNAFIRPSAAGGVLGGVNKNTHESILLCEAAGFDMILVETVGIGQSEAEVASMTDMFVLLLLPGGGDDLQGIKRGVMELADLVLINKADGQLELTAAQTAADYQNALQFMQPRIPGWRVSVKTVSALEGTGIDETWETMQEYMNTITSSGRLSSQRGSQAQKWMWNEVSEMLIRQLNRDPLLSNQVSELEQDVFDQKVPVTVAATRIAELIARDTGR